MSKTLLEKWTKLQQKAKYSQRIAGYFWLSDKTSDKDKFYLNKYLSDFEKNISNPNTDMALSVIHIQLLIDAVDIQVKQKPELLREYVLSRDKDKGYRVWIKTQNKKVLNQKHRHIPTYSKERE